MVLFKEGRIDCIEELLTSAKRVLRHGTEIRYDPFDKRVSLWNDIKESCDKYMDGKCGNFFDDLDKSFRSRFEGALLILAMSFQDNNETFEPAARFSDIEIEAYRKIERYNVFEILEVDDIKKRIISRERKSIKLLSEYYLHMGEWLDKILDDPSLKLSVRFYLKGKWKKYNDKLNKAVSGLITEVNWFRGIISECDGLIKAAESPQQIINIIDSVVSRTNFGEIREGRGAPSVNIEGSVVQRTEIGSVKRCPNSACGNELKGDENFCPHCRTPIARREQAG